jgi:hypothetical protein
MTSQQIHDATVDRLAAGLSDIFPDLGEHTVLRRVRCQLLDGFPECISTFDVVVVGANPRWQVMADGPVLGPEDAPWVAVNVVDSESLAEDTIGIPNTLGRTGVSEYVLFDPNGEFLRPAFQSFWNQDGELRRSWPALHGVFFSGLNFRLDVRGTDLIASRCGRGRVEEELFVLRWERDRLDPHDSATRTGLDARITRLEERRMRPRSSLDGVRE